MHYAALLLAPFVRGMQHLPSLSVIIPAFNEAGYLPQTLEHLAAAEERLKGSADASVQIVVADNASTDGTAELARRAGATVVEEAEHNIGRVRNAGAAVAAHDVLVFLDADTIVPPDLLIRIARAMTDAACAGGAVDTLQRPRSFLLRAYLKAWRVVGLLGGIAQGACQFCRKSVFQELSGYDETLFMGEAVDFYWRLKRMARRRKLRTCFVSDLQVTPSQRRFETWPLWRSLLWTNPFLVLALRHRRRAWSGWYRQAPR